MPNRNQIIIISMLGITALLIGYFKNPLNLSMGKRAEVQGPVPPTIVTNVITNLSNIIVTNVVTNTVPVKPKPNPVKPKPNPVKPKPNPVKPKPNPVKPKPNPVKPKPVSEKKIVGTYERKAGGDVSKCVLIDNGNVEYYVNGKKLEGYKWSIVGNEIHFVNEDGYVNVYRINPNKSITYIAYIIDRKRTDHPKESQRTYKKIK